MNAWIGERTSLAVMRSIGTIVTTLFCCGFAAPDPVVSKQAAKSLLSMIYLLTFVAILVMAIGVVWLILRRGRRLRFETRRKKQVKYFDLRGETAIDDIDDPPHEPSYEERKFHG